MDEGEAQGFFKSLLSGVGKIENCSVEQMYLTPHRVLLCYFCRYRRNTIHCANLCIRIKGGSNLWHHPKCFFLEYLHKKGVSHRDIKVKTHNCYNRLYCALAPFRPSKLLIVHFYLRSISIRLINTSGPFSLVRYL